MPIKEDNVVRHELIGLRVKVAKSTDSSVTGLKGRVVDESFNMLKVECDGKEGGLKEKSIPKRNSVFIFDLPNRTKVEVQGALLVGRPEDRIKKKLKPW
jgi:ribonuclease P protein subunit POP4